MSVCPGCGAGFNCGMVDIPEEFASAEPCWCTRLPKIYGELVGEEEEVPKCYCQTCLQTLIDKAATP